MAPLSVVAWRLLDPTGTPANCTIAKVGGEWALSVKRGQWLVVAERCESDDAAFARSTEIWRVLVERGWIEPRH